MDYKTLNLLKLLLAIFVVCMHYVGPDIEFLSFSVPIFFLISGYLFFYNPNNITVDYSYYIGKLKRRVSSLLVPYILWILLYYVYMRIADSEKLNVMMAGKNWFRIFWDANPDGGNPLLGPYWYLRDLMKCCLLSPCFYVLFKNKYMGSSIMALLLFLYFFSPFHILTIGFSTILFFSIGAFCGLHNLKLPEISNYHLVSILTIFLCVFILTYYVHIGKYQIYHSLYILLSFPALYFGLQWLQKRITIPAVILNNSTCSFFIYSIHMFFYQFAFFITTDCLKLEHGSRTIATPMALILSIGLNWIMSKYFHNIYNILMGCRYKGKM